MGDEEWRDQLEGDEPEQLQLTVGGRTTEVQLIAVGDDLADAEGLLFELAGDLDIRNRKSLSNPPYGNRAWTLETETGLGLLIEDQDAFLVYYAPHDPQPDEA